MNRNVLGRLSNPPHSEYLLQVLAQIHEAVDVPEGLLHC